jgi:hypothetical protein
VLRIVDAIWLNYTANRYKKPSEKPHKRANLLTIERLVAT